MDYWCSLNYLLICVLSFNSSGRGKRSSKPFWACSGISVIFPIFLRNFCEFSFMVSLPFIITKAMFILCLSFSSRGWQSSAATIYLFLILDYLLRFHLKKVFTGKNKNFKNTSVTEGALGRTSLRWDDQPWVFCFISETLYFSHW